MRIFPLNHQAGENHFSTKPFKAAYASIDLTVFLSIDRAPLAMHMPPSILAKWGETNRRLQPAVATVATGNNTFDNFRFLRCHWELAVADKEESWQPYQKGGTYQPYFAPAHLYIDLRDDARELKAVAMERVGTTAQAMQSSRWWGKPGLTYPRVSSVGFGVRCLPEGEVFGDKGICIFPKEGIDRLALLGLLNSTPVAEILQTFGRGRRHTQWRCEVSPYRTRRARPDAECARRYRKTRPDLRSDRSSEGNITMVRITICLWRPNRRHGRPWSPRGHAS